MSHNSKISSNRSFGFVFFVVFLIIAFWNFRGNLIEIKIFPLVISLIFLVLALLKSKILTPFNKIWHLIGIGLGKFIAPIVMGIIFFFVVTPIGFLMLVLKKDILNIKFNKNVKSYWIKKVQTSTSMRKQF